MSLDLKPPRPPLVLVGNDQEWSARSLESILGPNGYAVLRAHSGRQAIELARSVQPDAVIIDIRMPEAGGIEVVRKLHEDTLWNLHTPIVVTASGPVDRAQRLAAYRAGAWEFCSQPLDGEAPLLRLDTYMRAKREADRIRDESLIDPGTRLYTVRGLARRAREIGAEAQRRHDALACVVFTPVAKEPGANGELAAELLLPIAERLEEFVRTSGRASDVVGRLGQTEFAIIAPGTGAQGAVKLSERLQRAIETAPVAVGGKEHQVSIRAGYCAVADFAKTKLDAVEILLRAATALSQLRLEGSGGPFREYE